DVALNSLDDVRGALDKAKTAASAKSDTTSVSAIDAALSQRGAIQDQLTANFQSFEDFIQRPGKLREDLSGAANTGLVTPAALDQQSRVNAEWATSAQAFNAYV